MTLKTTAFIAYTVNALLLNLSARRRQPLTDIEHMLVAFLPVRCTQKQLEGKGGIEDGEMSEHEFNLQNFELKTVVIKRPGR